MNNIDRLNRFKVSEQEKVEIDAYTEKYKKARTAITDAIGNTVCSGYIIESIPEDPFLQVGVVHIKIDTYKHWLRTKYFNDEQIEG